eukprot:SAG25_NODE_401_length_8480_cov_3.553275_6_plen_968_part_00
MRSNSISAHRHHCVLFSRFLRSVDLPSRRCTPTSCSFADLPTPARALSRTADMLTHNHHDPLLTGRCGGRLPQDHDMHLSTLQPNILMHLQQRTSLSCVLLLFLSLCQHNPVNAQSKCKALGNDCTKCLELAPPAVEKACDWCQDDGSCFERGNITCTRVSLRSTKGLATKPAAICHNKCTNQSCPVKMSKCDGHDNNCKCNPGLRAEGEAGHATVCVDTGAKLHDEEVVGECIDKGGSHLCAAKVLSDPLFGCASSIGHDIMATYCRASCGSYCRGNPSKCRVSNDVDYANKYCIAVSEQERCQDTANVDYACPHHTLGSLVPLSCDSTASSRDDQCPAVFIEWWTRCGAKGKAMSHLGLTIPSQTQSLASFFSKCRSAQACTTSTMQRRIASITEECCKLQKESCKDGAPRNCNADCATVLLPFHKDCRNMLTSKLQAEFQSVANVCQANVKNALGPVPKLVVPPQTKVDRCQLLGGTCSDCLHISGCEWCELHARCYQTGKHICDARDTRKLDSTGIGADKVCSNKCTTRKCPVANSHCDPRDGKCKCLPGYRANGVIGKETACVSLSRESSFQVVASKCVDADKIYCGATTLAHPLFGCATRAGYTTMLSYCQASCGAFCRSKSGKCIDSKSGVDYSSKYCIPITGKNSCIDMTAVDHACPHHNIGRLVPATCDSPSSSRDDTCSAVFTEWWQRCGANGKVQSISGMTKSIADELQIFEAKCKLTIKEQIKARCHISNGTCLKCNRLNFDPATVCTQCLPRMVYNAVSKTCSCQSGDQICCKTYNTCCSAQQIGTCCTLASCGFESSSSTSLCAHTYSGKGQWQRARGHTDSDGTGPNGAKAGSWFFYLETSNGRSGDVSYIDFAPIKTEVRVLSFIYNMYGSTMGTLAVDIYDKKSQRWSTIWRLSGQQTSPSTWKKASIDLKACTPCQIRFAGTKGRDYHGDMAIDNIQFLGMNCAAGHGH